MESRETDSERSCSASLPLPVQSISFAWLCWIMDETIYRWAQLCSTDPLAHTFQIWSESLGKSHHIFLFTNNQSHSSHSHVCQFVAIPGISIFSLSTFLQGLLSVLDITSLKWVVFFVSRESLYWIWLWLPFPPHWYRHIFNFLTISPLLISCLVI